MLKSMIGSYIQEDLLCGFITTYFIENRVFLGILVYNNMLIMTFSTTKGTILVVQGNKSGNGLLIGQCATKKPKIRESSGISSIHKTGLR